MVSFVQVLVCAGCGGYAHSTFKLGALQYLCTSSVSL